MKLPRHSSEQCLPVDVRALVKLGGPAGVVRRGATSVGYALELGARCLRVGWASEGRTFAHAVQLVETYPHFGGRRWWALCPRCSRRCAVLHVYGVGTLGCRVCLELAYESTRETAFARACRRARGVRARLGADGNLTTPFSKPPRMHWTTFVRLTMKERAALDGVVESMGRSLDRLERRSGVGRGRGAISPTR